MFEYKFFPPPQFYIGKSLRECNKSTITQEFKWLWLVAGNRYLPYDGLGEVAMLGVGRLTVRGWGWENCVKCLKRGWNEKIGWGNKSF